MLSHDSLYAIVLHSIRNTILNVMDIKCGNPWSPVSLSDYIFGSASVVTGFILFPQVWFQNARAKFRRNLLRQESTGVDKASDGSTLQGGTPSGPASEISNASMSPSSTPTTLTDLTNPTMPTVTSVLTSVPGGMDVHECRSPSQTTLTSLFWWTLHLSLIPSPFPTPLLYHAGSKTEHCWLLRT